jgi:hypothetical protein
MVFSHLSGSFEYGIPIPYETRGETILMMRAGTKGRLSFPSHSVQACVAAQAPAAALQMKMIGV